MSAPLITFAPMKQRIKQLLSEMSAGLYDKETECALVLLTVMFAAQGAAMMECGGLVTEKVAVWRFQASE